MKIIVGAPQNATNKFKGDLLENLATKLLKAYNYEVQQELRRTGSELDLLCRSEVNHSKTIYVECKAYAPKDRIQSDVIVRLSGLKAIDNYEEVWLVTTSELGKDAKGLVEKISSGKQASAHTFITPERLIEALIKVSIIRPVEACTHEVKSLVIQERKISEPFLLITDFGYFWTYEYTPQGKAEGYIFYDAHNLDIITEKPLLNKLAELSQLEAGLDFSAILSLLDDDKASRLSTDDISLNEVYLSKINTMKFKISHSGKDELKNDDIFVYPDLQAASEEHADKIGSEKIVDDSLAKVIVFGDDLSGKTTLLQQYQIALSNKGHIPILIRAEDITARTLESFERLLIDKFEEQYSDSSEFVKFFRSLLEDNPDKIIVLLDDLQSIGLKRVDSQYTLMTTVTDRYPNIIITAHKMAELEILAKSEWKEIFQGFSQYNIMQLGHYKRDQLIEKWLVASGDELSNEDVHNGKHELATKINIAVGDSFVPTYPFYLLMMLQVLESGKNSLRGTAYGELYSYLITNALGGAGALVEDLDFYNTYLSNLAFKLFEDGTTRIDLIQAESFYNEYIEKMYIKKEFSRVHKLLIRSRLLVEQEGSYSFQFNYVAHYFVAKYLSDNYSLTSDQGLINKLVSNLYKDRYANIVIFLVHHSKNSELIGAILKEARSLFGDVGVHTLSFDELTKFNALLVEQVSPTFKDTDPIENRKEELTLRDAIEEQRDSYHEEINEKLDLFAKIKYSFRIMEVLGQIANNYYGSLDGPTKAEILNTLYELGLRSMSALLQEYEEYIDWIRNEVRQTIVDKKGKNVNADKLASDIIYSFTQLIVFAFIKKTSDSVISKNLFPTIEKLGFTDDHYAKHLITTAIKLNFPDELDSAKRGIVDLFERMEKNFLPRDVLRFLVLNHFYKYPVNHALKHSLSSALGIKLVQPSTKSLTSGI